MLTGLKLSFEVFDFFLKAGSYRQLLNQTGKSSSSESFRLGTMFTKNSLNVSAIFMSSEIRLLKRFQGHLNHSLFPLVKCLFVNLPFLKKGVLLFSKRFYYKRTNNVMLVCLEVKKHASNFHGCVKRIEVQN